MPSAYVRYFTTEDAEDAEATERLSPLLSSFFSLCPRCPLWFKSFLVPAEGRAVFSVPPRLRERSASFRPRAGFELYDRTALAHLTPAFLLGRSVITSSKISALRPTDSCRTRWTFSFSDSHLPRRPSSVQTVDSQPAVCTALGFEIDFLLLK